MSTIFDNAATLKAVCGQFRAMVELCDQLAELDSLDQSYKEYKQRLDLIKIDFGKMEAQLAAAEKDIATAKAEATKIRADAARKAKEKLDEANNTASSIIGKADARGAELKEKAEAVALEWEHKAEVAFKATEASIAELHETEKKLETTKAALRAVVEGVK